MYMRLVPHGVVHANVFLFLMMKGIEELLRLHMLVHMETLRCLLPH